RDWMSRSCPFRSSPSSCNATPRNGRSWCRRPGSCCEGVAGCAGGLRDSFHGTGREPMYGRWFAAVCMAARVIRGGGLLGRVAGVLVAALVLAGASAAQEFPAKPLVIIVPFPPGGATDILGRLLAEGMRVALG